MASSWRSGFADCIGDWLGRCRAVASWCRLSNDWRADGPVRCVCGAGADITGLRERHPFGGATYNYSGCGRAERQRLVGIEPVYAPRISC